MEYIYVVSTQGRIDIANIATPQDPSAVTPVVPMHSLLGDTRNVLVIPDREHAFVSDGQNGLYVFNVNQPYKPNLIFQWDTPGVLMDVAVTSHYVFLADGNGGVGVIYTPERNVFQANPDWYRVLNPSLTSEGTIPDQDCGFNALNVEVIPHIIKTKVSSEDQEKGYGRSLLHYYAYVASDQCGLKTLDFTISVRFTQQGLYITPGGATFGMVARGFGNVVKNTLLGLWTQSNNLGLLDIPRAAFVIAIDQFNALDQRIKDTAWLYAFGIFIFSVGMIYWLALIAHFVLPVRHAREAWLAFQRLLLYFRGMHGQIVNARRGAVATRELEVNRPGIALVDLNSAIVIEEYPVGGLVPRLIQGRVQKKRRDSGENLYQDRVEGPGLVFLKTFERIRGVADLRRQFRIRPNVETQTKEGIEVSSMVFILFALGELPEVLNVTYEGERKPENIRVIATQEEGVPLPGKEAKERQIEKVSALIDELDREDKWEIHRTLYRYKLRGTWEFPAEEADQSQRGPFLFDESRVFDAVASRPFDVDEKEIKSWTELPAHVAAGIFRNMVSEEYYDYLFQPKDRVEFPLRDLKRAFSMMVRNQGVLAFQYVENQDGSLIEVGQVWDESSLVFTPVRELRTPKPLRKRGLKVVFAGFGELKPTHQDVSSYLTRYWQSEWQREAMIKKSEYERTAVGIKNLARAQAQKAIVESYAPIFKQGTYSQEAITFRLMQSLEAAAADPATRRLLPRDTILMLDRIHRLLLPGDQASQDGGYPYES